MKVYPDVDFCTLKPEITGKQFKNVRKRKRLLVAIQLRADCCTVELYCVTITWQRFYRPTCSLQVTVVYAWECWTQVMQGDSYLR